MRKQKGITLIALIITIIVMLILVGISVTVALNGGLFETAKTAKEKTETAIKEETITGTALTEYYLAKSNGTTTAESMEEYVLQKNELQIGDSVDYNEGTGYTTTVDTATTENLEWKVLGVNDLGQIELISKAPTQAKLSFKGMDGYNSAVKTLNVFCDELYGQGIGADYARSVDQRDINHIKGLQESSAEPILYYFLASTYHKENVGYGVWGWISNLYDCTFTCVYPDGTDGTVTYGVRPVIILKNDVSFVDENNDGILEPV